ncbi:TPA: DUF1700 domain-containing protein [Streptococcus suis]
MTRYEYMTELTKQLRHLPKKDLEDTLDHFNEYFDEAGPDGETAIIEELGPPSEAAREILTNLFDKQMADEKPQHHNIIWLLGLAILAAPVGLPLSICLLLLFVLLILLVLAGLILLGCFWISAILGGLAHLLFALDLLRLSWSSGLLIAGLSLMSLAIGLIGLQASFHFGNKAILFVLNWVAKHIRSGGSHETI